VIGARILSLRTGRAHNMVNPGLTERTAPSRFDETLQQSVSGKSGGQIVAADRGFSMPSSAVPKATLRSVLRRFRRNRGGSAAVEFALVAPVFFALLFAIIETALVFFAGQVLETITQDSARQILTGQAQTAAFTQADFKTLVCSKIPALFSCANVYVDVESFPAFGNVSITSHVDASCNYTTMQYNPGGPGDTVVVQLFYQWPLIVTGLGYNIANCGGKRLLIATAAFRNEPY
jgi:Flp pilus assembly protein TadG